MDTTKRVMRLLDVQVALAKVTPVRDAAKYARHWSRLADRFDAIGLKCNAANCRTRAEYYGGFLYPWQRDYGFLPVVRIVPMTEA